MLSSLSQNTYALGGAGKEALLAALPEDLAVPEDLCLCLIDAARFDDPAQTRLLSEVTAHVGETGQYPIYVLTRADRAPALRSLMARLTARLRELGCAHPEVYPVCAEAARLFRLPTQGRELSEAEQSALAASYDRFCPAENSLPGAALTADLSCRVGGRDVSPLQLRLALENTGVPALAARLEELSESGCPAPKAPAPEPEAAPPQEEERPEPPVEAPAAAPEAAAPEQKPAAEAPLSPEAQQPVDLAAWAARIEAADLSALAEMEPTVQALPVDETASAELRAAIRRRRWDLQSAALVEMTAGYEEMSCAELLALAQSVRDSEYPDAMREKTLGVLHEQFESRELTELRELTQDCGQMDLPALAGLKDRIEQGPYSMQSRAPYIDLLNHRMDELHVERMEEACAGLEEADAEGVAAMREYLDGYDCADVLKSALYSRLEQRQDALDRQNLDKLTADLTGKTPEELDALATEISEGAWNPKISNVYLHRVRLQREAALAESLEQQTADLDCLDRKAVLALRGGIQEQELPDRLRAPILKRIDERLYRLDLMRLLTMQNDFDAMGFDEIDAMRARITREDLSSRSKVEYLAKISEREHALIYENAASHSALAQQIAAQFKLRLTEFDFSLTARDYDGVLKKFWGGTGLEQPRDIPAFLLDNASTLGFSAQRFWYKSGRGLAFLPLEEIERFQVMKQVFSATLQIVRKDSTYLLTDAKIFRANSDAVLSFLNECLRRWPEKSLSDHLTSYPIHTANFDAEALSGPIPEPELREEDVLQILRDQCAAEKLKDGTVAGTDAAAWKAKLAKLLQTFGLPENARIAWYDTSGLFGTMKDGIAVGPAGVWVLNSKQSHRLIPLDEIYSLKRVGKRAVLTTMQNETENLDCPLDMVPALADYLKGIQLCRFRA